MEDTTIKDFFTLASLATFQGSTMAVVVVTNSVGALVKAGESFRRWTAFIIALVIQIALVTKADVKVGTVVLAGLNAMLVFSAALGLNTAGVRLRRNRAVGQRFLAPWL